jgi:hypothetical protein
VKLLVSAVLVGGRWLVTVSVREEVFETYENKIIARRREGADGAQAFPAHWTL